MSSANPLIIHIVAQLRPTVCGVSDFALAVARGLETEFAVSSAFAIVNSNIQSDVPYPCVYLRQSELLEACRFLSQGRPAAILVHLSGYGFSRNGAPTELARALSSVRTSGQFFIAVYFHELFATGMPWKSAFWHSHKQQKAVRTIAEECDLLVTNTARHAAWLEEIKPRRSHFPLLKMPVASNVGESEVITPVGARTPSIVVFGLPATRRKAYEKLGALRAFIAELDVREFIDVGPDFDAPAELHGIPVRRIGVAAALDLATLLSRAKFGFAMHRPDSLAKSGVFAGFCAHGTIPVLAEAFHGKIDSLEDGVHVITPRTAKAAIASGVELCSRAAWEWYSQHRLRVHAEAYARLFPQITTEDAVKTASGSRPD